MHDNVYTIWAANKKFSFWVKISRKSNASDVVMGLVTAHQTEKVRLPTVKGNFPVAGITPHGGFQTSAASLLAG